MNNAKSLRTPILKNIREWRLLKELGRGSIESTDKAHFKGHTVAIKELFEANGMKQGKKFDRSKNIGKTQSP